MSLRAALRGAGCLVLVLWLAACAGSGDALRYRLANSGTHWDAVDGDRVLEDLRPRYPEFFAVVLDPARSEEPPVLRLRDDLEHAPVDRRSFDALNALAIGYFELNYRSESARDDGGIGFLTGGFRSAHLLAIPWRAYREIQDPRLRDAILDFYEDAGTGAKLGAAATAGRLVRIVESLAAKEPDPGRRARIDESPQPLRRVRQRGPRAVPAPRGPAHGGRRSGASARPGRGAVERQQPEHERRRLRDLPRERRRLPPDLRQALPARGLDGEEHVGRGADRRGRDGAVLHDPAHAFQPMQAEPLPWGSPDLAALTAYVEHLQAGFEPNPCAARSANPCNPCAMKRSNPCNPCAANPCRR